MGPGMHRRPDADSCAEQHTQPGMLRCGLHPLPVLAQCGSSACACHATSCDTDPCKRFWCMSTALQLLVATCCSGRTSNIPGDPCVCANGGTAATGSACTTDGANICTACTGEFYLNLLWARCDAWSAECGWSGQIEVRAPSNTQDRECSEFPDDDDCAGSCTHEPESCEEFNSMAYGTGCAASCHPFLLENFARAMNCPYIEQATAQSNPGWALAPGVLVWVATVSSWGSVA